MLTYADVCGRMLTSAGALERRDWFWTTRDLPPCVCSLLAGMSAASAECLGCTCIYVYTSMKVLVAYTDEYACYSTYDVALLLPTR